MKAVEAVAKATNAAVLTLSLRSLKERNLIVLTMKKESAITTAATIVGDPDTRPKSLLARTIEMRMPAAAGMGRPRMYLPGFFGAPASPVEMTLKRARRMQPQAT